VAECEEIPGLSGISATDIEALTELKEAITGWLAALATEGLPFPLPHRNKDRIAALHLTERLSQRGLRKRPSSER
jgi:predicted RNase H-like HicB family nuclease